MKLGVNIGYWGLGLSGPEQLQIVQEAERLGYDSVWAAEAYGSDAATVLAWLAGGTSTIKLGSAIFQIPGAQPGDDGDDRRDASTRSPAGGCCWASARRARRSPRAGTACASARQLLRTREYVAVVRKALARERLEFHGETIDLPLPDGPGKALKLTIAPVQERIPIYLAAIGPKNTRAGRRDRRRLDPDAVLARARGRVPPLLEEGAAVSGRSLDGFDIAPTVTAFITDDVASARDAMRPYIALYVGGMGSRKQNFYNSLVQRYGFEAAAKEVQDLYLEGKREEAMAALPDELIDMVALCGPRDMARERLRIYRDAGVGTLMISPMAWTLDDRLAQLRVLAELMGEI